MSAVCLPWCARISRCPSGRALQLSTGIRLQPVRFPGRAVPRVERLTGCAGSARVVFVLGACCCGLTWFRSGWQARPAIAAPARVPPAKGRPAMARPRRTVLTVSGAGRARAALSVVTLFFSYPRNPGRDGSNAVDISPVKRPRPQGSASDISGTFPTRRDLGAPATDRRAVECKKSGGNVSVTRTCCRAPHGRRESAIRWRRASKNSFPESCNAGGIFMKEP